MNRKNLSIATICWARDEDEEKLLRTSLLHLATLDIPVFITDGGSGNDFIDFLKGFSNFNVFHTNGKGVYAQAKQSLLEAYKRGYKYIFYTEPDKQSFFENGLPLMLNKLTEDENAGIIIASRLENGFATYPAFQQMTETTINNCCKEIIGNPVDYTYSPFILNSKLVPYLDLVNEDIGWGWRPYTFGIAKRLGYKLEAFTDDFVCPMNQREDNAKERIYRMRQLSENIKGLTLSTSIQL